MLSLRQVVQDYGHNCERLLSIHSFETPLSEEEVRFIQYYLNEMEKRFEDIVVSDDCPSCTATASQPMS